MTHDSETQRIEVTGICGHEYKVKISFDTEQEFNDAVETANVTAFDDKCPTCLNNERALENAIIDVELYASSLY